MGNGQLALIQSRELTSPQGLLNNKGKSGCQSGPERASGALIKRFQLAALQEWPLRGVPL